MKSSIPQLCGALLQVLLRLDLLDMWIDQGIQVLRFS